MRGTDSAALASSWTSTLATNIGTTNTSVANGTYGLSALQALIAAIPTTMIGTNSAFVASVGGLMTTSAHIGLPDNATTLMGYQKQIATDTETLSIHTLLYGGATAYADASAADDTGAGTTPRTAKKTITAAQVVAGVGGAVTVTAGTYVEDVVMSYANQEMHFEIGAVLDGTGTCLTVSGGSCKIVGPVLITPAADQIGVVIDTLGDNIFYDVKVKGAASAGGWDIDTARNDFYNCKASGVKAGAKAWDIGGSGTNLQSCSTAGTTTSIGYYVHGASPLTNGTLSNCTSVGHQTAGYSLDNISGMTIVDCSSGAGDGARVDTNNANVWCNYCFDDNVVKENVLSVTGANTEEYNLFKVTGAVKIIGIFADVETALTGTNTDCFLELFSENGAIEISKNADGVTLGALGAGSVIMRLDKEDKVLVVGDATTGPALIDQTDVKEEGFRVVEDRTGGAHVATYIRFVHTCAAGGTGTLHWHAIWEAVGEGYLAAA